MNTIRTRCRRGGRLVWFSMKRTPNGDGAESTAVDADAESRTVYFGGNPGEQPIDGTHRRDGARR